MREQIIYFAAILGSYLVGAIPFGFTFARVLKGVDLRTVGSGNIGATNAARALGGAWFFPIFALDFLKGFAPVFWAAPWIAARYPCPVCPFLLPMLAVACGGAAVAGHLWPVYLRLRGGKGVATGIGAIFAMNWLAGAVVLAVWLVVFLAFRYISLASVVGAAALPPAQHFTMGRIGTPYSTPWPITIFCVVVAAVVILKHRDNLRRLLRHEEKKFHFSKVGRER